MVSNQQLRFLWDVMHKEAFCLSVFIKLVNQKHNDIYKIKEGPTILFHKSILPSDSEMSHFSYQDLHEKWFCHKYSIPGP